MFDRSVTRVIFALAMSCGFASGCTSPVDTSTDDVVTAQGKTLGFSYDTNIDQITHMSCSNMPMSGTSSFNTSAYFSYRVGAYNAGGVTLNQSFYDSLKKFAFDKQADILAASPANTSTVLQLAIRGRLDYQNLYSKSGVAGGAVKGQDYSNLLAELGTDDTALTLVQNPQGARIKHLRNGSPGGYLLEGSLYFTDNAPTAQNVRNFLQGTGNLGSGLLTITYTNGGDTNARSAADVVAGSTVNKARSVYGKGYAPTFIQPAVSGLYSGYPANVLNGVTEQSLDGTALATPGTWTCKESMQLRIVRAADVNKTGANCVRQADPAVPSAELKIVRNTLKVEDWYVDLAHRCIIPKRSGPDCYGAVTDIKYSMGDTCTTDVTTGFSNCVQYASTCYRN